MWLEKIRESIMSKSSRSSRSSISSLNFDKELPKLIFDYRLNLSLYSIDKLIMDIFTDLKEEGFIADYC